MWWIIPSYWGLLSKGMPRYLTFFVRKWWLLSLHFWVKMNEFTFWLLEKTYKTSESGRSCDVTEGALEMSTELECEKAVPRIQHLVPGAHFAGSLSMADRPTGCFYHPGHTSIYWNTNSLAKASGRWQSICKQRKIALHFYFFLIYHIIKKCE